VNSPIRRVAAGCLLLCIALLINVTYVQGFWADELNERPANQRVLREEYSRERGPIVLADDEVVAHSVPTDGTFQYQREYPTDPELYAPVTGYDSWNYGEAAIERTQNKVLAGTDDRLFVDRLVDLIGGDERKGGAVKLTLDPEVQQLAWDALEPYNAGAVVAIDVKTGAIIAFVSRPSYDPNPLSSNNLEEQQAAWAEYAPESSDGPMQDRAGSNIFPPGSTFKLVVSAAAIESGEYDADSVIPGPAAFEPPDGQPIPNYNGQACGPGNETTLSNALRISCNSAFAWLGNELGADALREQARKFGFDEAPLTEIGTAASRFPAEDAEGIDSEALLGQASIGQWDVAATPLQVAMVTAAIANNGELMQPYLIDELRMSDLVSVLEHNDPEVKSRAISQSTARELTDMMVNVVENGTGSAAQIPGVQTAGKTGTAQSSEERGNYAWFTGFAPADDPEVAVAVFIQDSGLSDDDVAGGLLGGPIARDVMEAVLDQ
jgi:peptidoglycan glycosyltransferase